MDWHAILSEVGVVVIPILATFITGLLSKLIMTKVNNEFASGVLDRAQKEVFAATAEIGMTYVKKIKESAADGELTDAEKKAAKDAAVSVAKSNIGKKGLNSLAKVVGGENVSNWIGNKVETSVASLKVTDAIVKKPAPSEPSPK